MLPAAGTSGEAGALITAAALTTTSHLIKCPSHRLRHCSTKLFCGSSIWQAACRATAETSASQHAERIVGHKKHETPLVEFCGSEDWRTPLQKCEGMDRVSVALGKFDAMHIGHRKLASRAAELGGQPWLVSFSGMADVLGWPKRPPLVADADRKNVLASWTKHCKGAVPCQRFIPFAEVRNLSPEDFVQILAHDLQVSGVVVGKGFRFGYKAAGDTRMLQELGAAHGLDVSVVSLVSSGCTDGPETVSSSAVRKALAEGRIDDVTRCLGRPYRLLFQLSQPLPKAISRCSLQASDCQNQLPGDGEYSCTVAPSAGDCDLSIREGLRIPGARLNVRGESIRLELPSTSELPASDSLSIYIEM